MCISACTCLCGFRHRAHKLTQSHMILHSGAIILSRCTYRKLTHLPGYVQHHTPWMDTQYLNRRRSSLWTAQPSSHVQALQTLSSTAWDMPSALQLCLTTGPCSHCIAHGQNLPTNSSRCLTPSSSQSPLESSSMTRQRCQTSRPCSTQRRKTIWRSIHQLQTQLTCRIASSSPSRCRGGRRTGRRRQRRNRELGNRTQILKRLCNTTT